jgi:peptide/nickel transport system permease protein
VRPFVYATVPADPELLTYRTDPAHALPVRFLVRGAPYRLLGLLPADRHLFGVDAPGRIYLLGADPLGRDELTRLLFGAQVSLTVGLVGILLSFALGLVFGGIAGYAGGWIDALIMRSTEVLLSIPGLYLIIALRGAFPRDLPSRQVYLAIVVILSLIGWAALARVIRGMVLSIRTQDYVVAAEALGMSRARVLIRHILPNTATFVIVAATLAVPGYILGEVFLSFLGLGVQEPSASWGNMLQQGRNVDVMRGQPWLLFAPAIAIFLTVMAFNILGDGLRDALDPRRAGGRR